MDRFRCWIALHIYLGRLLILVNFLSFTSILRSFWGVRIPEQLFGIPKAHNDLLQCFNVSLVMRNESFAQMSRGFFQQHMLNRAQIHVLYIE